jgi:hypothetical protein
VAPRQEYVQVACSQSLRIINRMARNQIEIFAGPVDLKALLEAIEATNKLKYTLTGLFDSPS